MAAKKTQQDNLKPAREEIVRIQIERFRNDYAEFFDRPDTQKLVDFFFGKVYDIEAQESIIDIAINTYDKFKGQLSGETRENLENLIELNKLTQDLDTQMASLLLQKGWQEGEKLTIAEYIELYKELGEEEKRRQQLLMAVKSMMVSYQLAHKPFSELILKAARGVAVMFGVTMLHDFAEEGYKATKAVKADVFNQFIDKVTENEVEFLEKAFG